MASSRNISSPNHMGRQTLALAEIISLWFALTATIASFWRAKKPAGVLLAPYLARVSFATALNPRHLADEFLRGRYG
jgi:tryptophan-rich sensory protein